MEPHTHNTLIIQANKFIAQWIILYDVTQNPQVLGTSQRI